MILTFQNKKYLFITISTFFLFFVCSLKAQNLEYEIDYFNNSSFFYNSIVFNNNLYVGSKDGIFELKENELTLYDSSVKGPIKIESPEIKKGNVVVSQLYNNLLPAHLKNDPSNVTSYGSKIYIITNGKLFVFTKNAFNKKSVGSVRSISENYIGTYNGVIKKEDNSKIIRYTNSYIREFDQATFICWDGLYYITGSTSKNFNNPIYEGISIGDSLLGKANDIVEINHPNYILSTDKALYFLNVENETVQKISDQYRNLNFANYPIFIKDKSLSFVLFSHENIIYSLDKKSSEINELYTFNSPVISFLYGGAEVMYVLLEDRLVKFNPAKNEKKVVLDNLTLVNDVGIFRNFVFVTSDEGLHLYDVSSGLFAKNILSTELNKKAFYVNEDNLYLGGVSGLFTFEITDLTNFFLKKINEPDTKESGFLVFVEKIKWLLLLLLIGTLIVNNIFFYKKYRTLQLKFSVQGNDNELKYDIEQFIDENLNTINIEILKTEFKLSNYALYNIMDRINPGEVIRRKRMSLTKKLRKQGVSELEISKQTGFSLSYLKKI